MNFAPIVLFVYNRPWHTRKTIESLKKNKLAEDSILYIFSDGPKNNEDENKVKEVRKYIYSIDDFKKVAIIKRGKNWGLADSIIDGVTKIVNEYGKIIVLEDDLVTSKYFLKFMNKALEFYKDEDKVWHISGWNYQIDIEGLTDVFLWRVMNCSGGWATWAARWEYFEKNTKKLINEFSKEDIFHFNLDGSHNFWQQVIKNNNGTRNTWAIFWYANIFKNNGLCLNPSLTYVKNIGFDGSGMHSGKKRNHKRALNSKRNLNYTNEIKENILALNRIKKYYKSQKKTFFLRVIKKIFSS